ncbi:5-carboxymethyl-2-hydroxymuconate Delta-isomerase [Undibacterium sp.]|uniref:5-carboxymethyl-2-hydroxymuconate Delta-isomerase n=1 Tax=Undibacterium sp. TaxID=1914977 RepID=UPI00374D3F69
MPQLYLEYTANLSDFDAGAALGQLNNALAATGEFEEADIKSRAQKLEHFAIGTAPAGRAFVHVRLAMLSGRSAETKRLMSDTIVQALHKTGPWPAGMEVQLTAEILDMERASYGKARVQGEDTKGAGNA